VLTLKQQLTDCAFHCRPFVHHLRVAESHDTIAKARERSIPSTIGLECVGLIVKLPAIHLNDEPITEQKIDSANSRNPNLLSERAM